MKEIKIYNYSKDIILIYIIKLAGAAPPGVLSQSSEVSAISGLIRVSGLIQVNSGHSG